MGAIFFLILFVMLFVGSVVFGKRLEQQRTEELRQVAPKSGLTLVPDDGTLLHRLSEFHLFTLGRNRRIKNLLRGAEKDPELLLFDYQHTSGSGKNAHTHRQSVLYFRSSTLSLPKFEMRSENVLHKIGKAFGYQDIDFDSHPDFSKKYLLRGKDEESIRNLFGPEVLSFFEQQPKISVEAAGDQLICYRWSKRIDPDEILSFTKEGLRILAQLQAASE